MKHDHTPTTPHLRSSRAGFKAQAKAESKADARARSGRGSAKLHSSKPRSQRHAQHENQQNHTPAYCGCPWLAMPYAEQLREKNHSMRELFNPWIHEHSCTLNPIIGMELKDEAQPCGFRYKVATPFAEAHTSRHTQMAREPRGVRARRGGRASRIQPLACGFYAPGTHAIIPCTHCPSEAPQARDILNFIAYKAAELGISAYNEDSCTGDLRHAILRISKHYNESMLVLVTRVRNFPQKKTLVRAILRAFPQLTTIVQNVNARNTNAMLGTYTVPLFGPGKIRDKLLGCTFEIGPCSFFQTNPQQTEILYQVAIDGVQTFCQKRALPARKSGGLKHNKAAKSQHSQGVLRIMDAYCGCGTIGICLASQIENALVVGIDQVEDSIERARRNRKLNHLGARAVYSLDDATHFMQDFVYASSVTSELSHDDEAAAISNDDRPRFDAIIMDPPRAGSTPEFIAGACALAPTCIVYISCNPVTQERDLHEFYAHGYVPRSITPVDMFPHTPHVESVVLMSRAD